MARSNDEGSEAALGVDSTEQTGRAVACQRGLTREDNAVRADVENHGNLAVRDIIELHAACRQCLGIHGQSHAVLV